MKKTAGDLHVSSCRGAPILYFVMYHPRPLSSYILRKMKAPVKHTCEAEPSSQLMHQKYDKILRIMIKKLYDILN